MEGVCDETPLTLDVTLDTGHHRVEGVGHVPQLVAATPHADPVLRWPQLSSSSPCGHST